MSEKTIKIYPADEKRRMRVISNGTFEVILSGDPPWEMSESQWAEIQRSAPGHFTKNKPKWFDAPAEPAAVRGTKKKEK